MNYKYKTSKEIAKFLGISEKLVKKYNSKFKNGK